MHFEQFLDQALGTIKPEFVLATGDLTDAKSRSKITSMQHEEEWKLYFEALQKRGILERKDFWLDLRGNHDCFDVPHEKSPLNYFRRYSAMKRETYSVKHVTTFGTYGIVAIDGWYSFVL